MSCGNNYLSQNPAEIHVGLGGHDCADKIHVEWPDGSITVVTDVAAGQSLVLQQPESATPLASRALHIANAQPNPFQDTVTLTIEGAGAGVSATVYDVAGRRIRDLTTTSALLEWDGRDARGARAPAGVYWIRVSDGRTSDTRRLVHVH